jgi:hypothetical protein
MKKNRFKKRGCDKVCGKLVNCGTLFCCAQNFPQTVEKGDELTKRKNKPAAKVYKRDGQNWLKSKC